MSEKEAKNKEESKIKDVNVKQIKDYAGAFSEQIMEQI